jgi:ceramide glucosyltransferase
MIATVLIWLIIASWLYWVVCTLFVHAFIFQSERKSLGVVEGDEIPVSILKPVRGVDPYQYDNFTSFCNQQYGDYEILFAVADALDPAVPVIRRLQANFPERNITLLIVPVTAANQKVGLLDEFCQVARHDLLVISDSDMRVSPDYLRRVVRPLSEAKTGLVTCSYRGIHVESIPSCLGALHMGVMFLPSVMVARKFIDMQFAMGATIAIKRQDLEQLGGFGTIADYLADDFQLAIRIIEGGKKVVLSDYVVSSVLGAQSFREQWGRELRWARTNRSNRPFEYPGLAPLYTITWAILYLLATDFSFFAWQVFWATLFFRWLIS